MWTASPTIPSSKTWGHHMLTEHPGAVTFIVLDIFLLSGAFALTVAQASQVMFFDIYLHFCC